MAKFGLQDKITFGKYKDTPMEEVIETDPQYLRWCVKNIEWFDVDDEVSEILTANYFECKDCKSRYSLNSGMDVEDHITGSGVCKYCGYGEWGIFNAEGELIG